MRRLKRDHRIYQLASVTVSDFANSFHHSLTESCTKKCVPADYREGDLNKGESVCLDRCVSKFFDVNIKVSEKMQGEAAAGKQGGGMGLM